MNQADKTRLHSLIELSKTDGWVYLKKHIDEKVNRLLLQGKQQPDQGAQIQKAADMAFINGMLDVVNEVNSAVDTLKKLEEKNKGLFPKF